jgi:hypothetical protein
LVNSSPYYRGSRLAASARSEIYRWKAYENLPNQGELWSYAEDTEEWAKRLQRRYEAFVTRAIVAGVDGAEVRIDGKRGSVTDEAVVLLEFDAVQELVQYYSGSEAKAHRLRVWMKPTTGNLSTFIATAGVGCLRNIFR